MVQGVQSLVWHHLQKYHSDAVMLVSEHIKTAQINLERQILCGDAVNLGQQLDNFVVIEIAGGAPHEFDGQMRAFGCFEGIADVCQLLLAGRQITAKAQRHPECQGVGQASIITVMLVRVHAGYSLYSLISLCNPALLAVKNSLEHRTKPQRHEESSENNEERK